MTYFYKPAVGKLIITDTDLHVIGQDQSAYQEIRIINRTLDDSANATNGNAVLIGGKDMQPYELVSGAEVRFKELAPFNVYVKQLYNGTPTGVLVIGWIASGRLES